MLWAILEFKAKKCDVCEMSPKERKTGSPKAIHYWLFPVFRTFGLQTFGLKTFH